MKRYHAILAAASVAVLLAACGGGDDESTPLDLSGVLTGSSPQSFTYVLNGQMYGYQVDGATTRYFKGGTYSPSGTSFTFNSGHYDDGVQPDANSRDGAFNGQYSATSDSISLSFTLGGSATNNFDPMTATYSNPWGAVQSLTNDYAGTYAQGITVTVDSATKGKVSGTLNGCTFSGDMVRPRSDRNVWTVALLQSACTDTARNGKTSNGLATLSASGATRFLRILSTDELAWNRIEVSK